MQCLDHTGFGIPAPLAGGPIHTPNSSQRGAFRSIHCDNVFSQRPLETYTRRQNAESKILRAFPNEKGQTHKIFMETNAVFFRDLAYVFLAAVIGGLSGSDTA